MTDKEKGLTEAVLFIYTLTPLHVGVGSTPEVVDLPIQREKHTGFPVIFGSSLKGAIRSNFDKDIANALFGNEDTSTQSYASAVSFTDARILLFPVKTARGIFAYVTCPFVLRRLERELKIIGINNWNGDFTDGKVHISSDGLKELEINDGLLILEEFSYNKAKGEIIEDIRPESWKVLENLFQSDSDETFKFWQEKLKKHIVVVPDEDFRYLVKHGTEIVTRIKIDDNTGVVKSGALWTEENVPTDTLFYSITLFDSRRAQKGKIFDDIRKKLDGKSIHIGGNTTIGRGFVYLKFYNGGNNG
ncbi:MAG: type III-B CRISPR module RAMP protein Cmr4 [Candidatus Omnitrophota bacterium]|nr:MAG: type III-B CRISPR module RAMP protein Cmr4 [Candidatus Omnitrophota bacterium]